MKKCLVTMLLSACLCFNARAQEESKMLIGAVEVPIEEARPALKEENVYNYIFEREVSEEDKEALDFRDLEDVLNLTALYEYRPAAKARNPIEAFPLELQKEMDSWNYFGENLDENKFPFEAEFSSAGYQAMKTIGIVNRADRVVKRVNEKVTLKGNILEAKVRANLMIDEDNLKLRIKIKGLPVLYSAKVVIGKDGPKFGSYIDVFRVPVYFEVDSNSEQRYWISCKWKY